MTCREISPEVLRNARTLEDAYTALGVLRPAAAAAAPIAPPRTFLPEGSAMNAFPYLTGTDGRNFNLGPLFANEREQYNCVIRTLGYNETRARELATESAEMDDAAFQTFVNGLSASDALSFNFYRTLSVMEFMRTDPPAGDRAAGGNTDNNRDVISAPEVENWAWERTNHDETLFRQFGGDAVGRLHALLGIANLLTTDPVSTRTGGAIVRGANFDVAAPEGGWRSGDRVMVDTTRIDGAPTSGSDAFRVLGSALPVGTHTLEIRRADGSILRTPVTVSAPPADPSSRNRIGAWMRHHWQLIAEGAGALVMAGAAYMLGRHQGTSSGPANSPTGNPGRAPVAERPAPTPSAPATAPINVEVRIDNSSARSENRTEGRAGYDEVIRNIGEEAPGEGVLGALAEGEALPSVHPFHEILTYAVNDAAVEAQLRTIDPALADFYRANISNPVSPVTNISDLIVRIGIANPNALTQAQAAIAAEGRPASEMPERVVFELVARAADWNPADAAARPTLVARFETAVRDARRVETRESSEGREARENRERSEREAREGRSSRP